MLGVALGPELRARVPPDADWREISLGDVAVSVSEEQDSANRKGVSGPLVAVEGVPT